MEAAICAVITLSSFDVLRVLSGADYLHVFEADRLQALASIYVGVHGAGYNVAEIFLGLGSTVFGYLWFESMPGSHLLQSTTYKTMVQSLYEFCTDASKPVRSNSLTML